MSIINKGLAILTPEDAIARREIERYISDLLDKADYLPLYSPHIGDVGLFETSGHYPYYKDSMFPLIEETAFTTTEEVYSGSSSYVLKPMNCPFHILAYQEFPRSYKDLPIRYCEFGTVYRNEASGAINGMFRLRGFTQDDGHIFCTMDQVEDEVRQCIALVQTVMLRFDMSVKLKLSIRSFETDSEKYVGNVEDWKKAQDILVGCIPDDTLDGIDHSGAAFYGPKIDFAATDKFGREWQLGTVQLDFNLPNRFELEYKTNENGIERPVMIHRALLGSIERFLAILKEQGDLPFWLRAEQSRVIPVHADHMPYAESVYRRLRLKGIRATIEKEVAPLSAKIQKCILANVPSRAVVGSKDIENNTVSVVRPGNDKTVVLDVDNYILALEFSKIR